MTASNEFDGIAFPPNLAPIRLLGHGSMASVYLARDRNLKRLVAIKLLHAELCDTQQNRQRFEREAQAAARLSHDSITTVFSVGQTEDERPYIEVEYIDGANLEDLIRSRGAFDVREACEILSQIASALATAHESNVVHRDVKPANILVDNTTRKAALTDFGIAAILQTGDVDLTRLTREGEILGSPRYMSPEQLRGEALTGQSDVYSLGVVAFELLAGTGPFDDPEISDMWAAHIRRPAPDLSARRADVPRELSDLIKRCLAKKPEHRPGARDLARFLQDPTGASESQISPPLPAPIASFFSELKQRRVYQAAAAYAAITFVLLQVLDLLLQPWPQLNLVYQLAVISAIGGFPITVVLAWIYDLQSGKLVVTPDAAATGSGLPARRRRIVIVGLALSVGIAVVAAWLLLRQ